MTKLTIGRVGLDVDVDGVLDWDFDGDRLSVRLEIYSSVVDALVIRQQILGYVDSADEGYVPVTWDVEPEADGYYIVESASVKPHRDGADLFYVDVTLRRVLGYAAPLLELTTLGAVRTNGHSATATQAICVPDAAKSVGFNSSGTYAAHSSDKVREGAYGSVKVYWRLTSERLLTQFFLPPANHYSGAATLYVGSGLRAAVGRQIPNEPTAWRLSNGILEVEPVPSSSLDLQFRMWLSASDAWSPWVAFSLVSGLTLAPRTPMKVPHSITVLRNGPEEVALRLLTTSDSSDYSPVTVDFSLKRGSRHLVVEMRSAYDTQFGLRCVSFAAATAVGTSYRWKTIGAVQMLLASPYDTQQTTNDVHPDEGGDEIVDQWAFGVGLVEGSDAIDTRTKTVEEYFFASSAKQTVVAQ